jgi:hypothetical protein
MYPMSLEEQYLPLEIWVSIFDIFNRNQNSTNLIFNLRLVCKDWINGIDNMKPLNGKIYLSSSNKKEIENIPKNITSLELSFEKEHSIDWISYITSPLPNITKLSFTIKENYIPGYLWRPETTFYPEIIRNIYPNISEIIIIHNLFNDKCLVALVRTVFSKDEGKILNLYIRSFGRFNYQIKGPNYSDMRWSSIESLTIEGCNDLKNTMFNLPGLKEINLSVPHGHEDEKIVADKLPNVKINNIITD